MQVYVVDEVTSVTWVNQALVAVERVKLEPGEKRTLRLFVPHERLSLVDAYGRRLVEPGEFELLVGGCSRRSALQRGRFRVDGPAFNYEAIPGVSA